MVSWTKNGQPLDTKRVNIRSTERDSILFIRTSEREDSGVYEMCVKVDDFEDRASLILQIVGEQNIEILSKRLHMTVRYTAKGGSLDQPDQFLVSVHF